MGEHIIINDARCSFPQLYGDTSNEGVTYKPGITLILEAKKHAAVIQKIKDAMNSAIASNNKLKKAKADGDLTPNLLCLRSPKGSQEELKYLEGNLILKAGNPKPPRVLNPDKTVMTQETDRIVSGCYVNAKVDIWGQDNRFGLRVNAKLIAVQFIDKEFESFDGSYTPPEVADAGFESLEDTASADGFLDENTSKSEGDSLFD